MGQSGKYFSITKKISVAASVQNGGVISDGNLIADWQAIEIPKGASCLKSLTVLARPKGDATPTPNTFAAEFFFSKTNTVSLGTPGGAVTHYPMPDMIGLIKLDGGAYGTNVTNGTAIASTGMQGNEEQAGVPLILQGDPTTGDNVGFDTIYVGIMSSGNWTFGGSSTNASLNAIAEAGTAGAASTQVITMDGSGMDVREHFATGDVVHIGTSVGDPAADSLIGTIASVDSATQLTLESTSATDLVDGDILYNIHPITLVLGFEQ